MLDRNLLTIREATDELRIGTSTFHRIVNRGELATAKIGGRTLVRRADLDAYIDRAAQPRPAGGTITAATAREIVGASGDAA